MHKNILLDSAVRCGDVAHSCKLIGHQGVIVQTMKLEPELVTNMSAVQYIHTITVLACWSTVTHVYHCISFVGV